MSSQASIHRTVAPAQTHAVGAAVSAPEQEIAVLQEEAPAVLNEVCIREKPFSFPCTLPFIGRESLKGGYTKSGE